MSVTVDRFSTRVFKVLETFLDRTRKERSVWKLPARFCCMQFINDSRNFSRDMSAKLRRRAQPRANTTSFVEMFYRNSASELKDLWMIAVNAICNIDNGEEW